MINITKKLCKNFSEREGWNPDVIVVHISAGSMTSMTSWFQTPNSQASAHYGISKSGEIIKYVSENKKAWANGRVNNPSAEIVNLRKGVNPNLYTISIENEGMDLRLAPEKQLSILCQLIEDIAKRWNIPLDRQHILGHFEIDGINRPYCPSPDHTIMDKIIARIQQEDEIVNIQVKKSQLDKVLTFIKTLN